MGGEKKVESVRSAPDLTALLRRWREGDVDARDALMEATYEKLAGVARAHMAGERANHTLTSGALVHEAYLRLIDLDQIDWRDRAHFIAMASRTMRRVLVDYAKARRAQKRGGGAIPLAFDDALAADERTQTVLEIDDALRSLETVHPRTARVLELTYLGDLTQREIAEALDISQPTVNRDLQFGRAWLAREWGRVMDPEAAER